MVPSILTALCAASAASSAEPVRISASAMSRRRPASAGWTSISFLQDSRAPLWSPARDWMVIMRRRASGSFGSSARMRAHSFPAFTGSSIVASVANMSADMLSPALSESMDLRMSDSASFPQLSTYVSRTVEASASIPNPISILTASRYSSEPAHSLSRYARSATIVSLLSPVPYLALTVSSMVLGEV